MSGWLLDQVQTTTISGNTQAQLEFTNPVPLGAVICAIAVNTTTNAPSTSTWDDHDANVASFTTGSNTSTLAGTQGVFGAWGIATANALSEPRISWGQACTTEFYIGSFVAPTPGTITADGSPQTGGSSSGTQTTTAGGGTHNNDLLFSGTITDGTKGGFVGGWAVMSSTGFTTDPGAYILNAPGNTVDGTTQGNGAWIDLVFAIFSPGPAPPAALAPQPPFLGAFMRRAT